MSINDLIRDVPDFPKPGILFKDITPVLADGEAFAAVTHALSGLARVHGANHVLGIESRGFIFGTAVATALGIPFSPVRKPGKLPRETRSVSYDLEYGTDTLEVHAEDLGPHDRVVIIDDLMATGGTAEAACQLAESCGATVAAVLVVVELTALKGSERLAPRQVYSLVKY